MYSTIIWWFFHVVEFPAVLLNTSTGEIESEFHAYVQPQEHPILSEFCMELTGIKQVCPLFFPLLILPFQQKTSRKDVNIKTQRIKAICHVELDSFTVRNTVPSRSPLESLKIRKNWTSTVVQWLWLCTPTAEVVGLIPGWEIKIPPWYSKKKKKKLERIVL